jgi:dTDP-4-amino-4,6-dideoxygalactose transaminase
MAQYSIPFIRPVFPAAQLVSADIASIIESNWYTNFGPKEREFSRALGTYVGAGFTAATFTNATIALMAAFRCLLGKGDETRYVVVPSFTFAAGPLAIEWCGYRPLFVDVDLDTLQPSLAGAERAFEEHGDRIAAVLVCNTFGIGNQQIADWEELAERRGVPLVVDSAAGFGSRYETDRLVGTAGTCEVFSFHATKPFAIGEGGAVVTRDATLARLLEEFSNFGFRDGKGAIDLGLNGKLQEISAAIGLRQLVTLDGSLALRRTVLSRYIDELAGDVNFPANIQNSSVCFATMLLPDTAMRDRARAALDGHSIEARTYYSPPVHRQPNFAKSTTVGELPITDVVVGRILSVPVHQQMTESQVAMIVDTIRVAVR